MTEAIITKSRNRTSCILCSATKEHHQDRGFFYFPKDERALKWAEYTGLPNLLNETIEQLHRHRLCSLHFEECDIIKYRKKRLLRRNAIPSMPFDYALSSLRLTKRLRQEYILSRPQPELNSSVRFTNLQTRFVATTTSSAYNAMATSKGLVLGVYLDGADGSNKKIEPTAAAQKYNDSVSGALLKLLSLCGSTFKKGKSRVFYGLSEDYQCVAVVGLGPSDVQFNEQEELDEKRENIRSAIGVGVKQLREIGASTIDVDLCDDAEAAAEGGGLSLFCFDDLKQASSKKCACTLNPYSSQPDTVLNEWQRGLLKAEGQNFARRLMETPANIMTPTHFAQVASSALTQHGVDVIIRDKDWAVEKKMGSFLSVTKGSDEPPVFLEISYKGLKDDTKPVVLVGKGVTFDSGGISLKPSESMDKMRADMGGAACVVSSIYTAAALKLPINVIGLTPLCENMPSGKASKPGDVVTAMNGKTIQIDNTDAEGRLILADALCYAHTFQPVAILDFATLTGAMIVAVGSAVTGVFTNCKVLWDLLHQSGGVTGDRMWRMPLFEHYKRQVTECHLADVNNIGSAGRYGGACTAAAFLGEFVTSKHWAHCDIAGVMECKDELPFVPKGMAGRPVRTVVEFLRRFAEKKPL